MNILLTTAVMIATSAAQANAYYPPAEPSPMILEAQGIVVECLKRSTPTVACFEVQGNRYAIDPGIKYYVGEEVTIGFTLLDAGDGNLVIQDIEFTD